MAGAPSGGLCVECAASGTGNSVALGASNLYLTTTAVTVVIGYRKTDSTLRTAAAFGVENGAGPDVTTRCGAHLPYSDGVVYWDFGGVTAGSTRVTYSSGVFGDDTWVFTVGARGMEIWQNGFLRASNAATPTRTSTTNPMLLFSGQGNVGAGISDLAQVTDFKLYPTQVSKELCRFLSHPDTRYDLWATPPQVRPAGFTSAPAGGVGPLIRGGSLTHGALLRSGRLAA